MKVLVISGFLGAGKTTFIKELIRQTGREIAVLENEFGDTNIDGQSISSNSSVNVLELTEGCVCCTMREGFFNSVVTVASAIDPEFLIVEPSGVAKLSNIMSNLQKASYENITLLPPIVLLPPMSFQAQLSAFPDICTDQLRNADRILFTKAEHESPETLGRIAGDIREINPDAEIVTEHYSRMDRAWWESLLQDGREAAPAFADKKSETVLEECSFSSVSLNNPAELIVLLEDALRGEYGNVVRAKGVVLIRQEKVRFDLADRLYSIIGDDDFVGETQCVFIGTDLQRRKLHESFIHEIHAVKPAAKRLKRPYRPKKR